MDFNNFGNLFEITGRDFKQFKERLMMIDIPVQELAWGVKPSGQWYGLFRADRPVKEKNQRPKANKKEMIVNKAEESSVS